MILQNREIVSIYRACEEAVGCVKAKENIKDSFKFVYAFQKTMNKLKPYMVKIFKEERGIRDASAESQKTENQVEINKQLIADLEALFERADYDVLPHKVSRQTYDELQKYLTGPATTALLNYLTIGEEFFEKDAVLPEAERATTEATTEATPEAINANEAVS